MRTLFAFVLCWFVAAGVSHAQMRVISGDHNGFTRLVVLERSFPAWQLGRVDDGFELRLEDNAKGFDISGFFNLIGRSRISDIYAQGSSVLSLSLACDCSVNAFEIDAGLVIDVFTNHRQEFELAFDERNTSANVTTQEPDSAEIDQIGHLLHRRATPVRNGLFWSEKLTITAPMGLASNTGVEDRALDTTPDVSKEDTSQFRTNLNKELARAYAQGLLDLENDPASLVWPLTPLPTMELSSVPHVVNAETTDERSTVEQLSTNDHIAIETAFSRATETGFFESEAADSACGNVKGFQVADWNLSDSAENFTSFDRSDFVNDLDETNIATVEKAAKHYLFYGFGIEAFALLEAFGITTKTSMSLRNLAEIIEDIPDYETTLNEVHLSCDSQIALWALLATDSRPALDEKTRSAVLLTFSELPFHLRRHLGPKLVRALTQSGEVEAAKLVSEAIKRSPDTKDYELDLVMAEIELAEGETEMAIARLGPILARRDETATSATVRIIDAGRDEGISIPIEHALDASALSFETKGSETSGDLKRVSLRSAIYSGNLVNALVEIQSAAMAGAISPEIRRELLEEVRETAVQRSGDAEFVAVSFLIEDPKNPTGEESYSKLFLERLTNFGISRDRLVQDTKGTAYDAELAPMESEMTIPSVDVALTDETQPTASLSSLDTASSLGEVSNRESTDQFDGLTELEVAEELIQKSAAIRSEILNLTGSNF